MVWTRGSRDDYDRWAKVTGDDGWGWDKLEPYMRKVCIIGPVDACIIVTYRS